MENNKDEKLDPMENTNEFAAGREGEKLNEEPNENDITPEERELLDNSFEDDEERNLHDAELDDRDADGTLLNERSSGTAKSGRDLDVPGSETDDDIEDLGEEDEENNSYSLPDQGDKDE